MRLVNIHALAVARVRAQRVHRHVRLAARDALKLGGRPQRERARRHALQQPRAQSRELRGGFARARRGDARAVAAQLRGAHVRSGAGREEFNLLAGREVGGVHVDDSQRGELGVREHVGLAERAQLRQRVEERGVRLAQGQLGGSLHPRTERAPDGRRELQVHQRLVVPQRRADERADELEETQLARRGCGGLGQPCVAVRAHAAGCVRCGAEQRGGAAGEVQTRLCNGLAEGATQVVRSLPREPHAERARALSHGVADLAAELRRELHKHRCARRAQRVLPGAHTLLGRARAVERRGGRVRAG
mmetsp:Transcript_4802/g.11586  ORF Transcript_4802/g.11586 Transcript_4802/m.11586 type:complete len:304 (-) Transcript_4802:1027-1938(-)